MRNELRSKFTLFTFVSTDRGQSLVQILIGTALIATLAVTFASLISSMTHIESQLNQKLAELDFERSVTTLLGDGSVCTYVLTHPAITFDPMALPAVLATLASLPSSGSGPPPNAVLADDLTPVSPLSQSLVSNSMKVTGVQCSAMPCTATSNQFNANLQIAFDATKLVMALKTLSFPITFITTGPADNQTISTCLGSGTGAPIGTCSGLPLPLLGAASNGAIGNGGSACQLNTACNYPNGGPTIAGTLKPGVWVCSSTGWACTGSYCTYP